MMPPPPPPGAGRAVIGFPIGGVILTVITAVIRGFLQGIPAFLVDVQIMGNFFEGWFWDDESTLMLFLLGGAIGFLWGAGMFYDFSKPRPVRTKALRIPADPDAPPDLDRNLIAPLFEAIPAVVGVVVVLGIVLALVGVIPMVFSTAEQTTNESATTSEYGDNNFNLLGVLDFGFTDQAGMFVLFAAVVVALIVGTALGLALLFYILNREVKTVEVKAPTPLSERDGPIDRLMQLNNRLIEFFTNWALDVLDAVSSAVKTR
jgi:hypothetical protein